MIRLCGAIESVANAALRAGPNAAAIGLAVALGAAAPPASADVFTRHGLDFVHVGDPGNRGATAQEAPLWPAWAPPLGAVDHDFGIMRTNITNEQWVEFVRAYAPHYPGQPFEVGLTGTWITYAGMQGGVPQFSVPTGTDQFTADPNWRVAARFCNWLHNGKVNEAWAFEDGAYDTSTFGEVVVGGITMITDQVTHHPDARFWIPTIDEYTKAGYYDPDRYGPGQGGYWLHPGGSDDPLVAVPPGVGQAAGNWAPPGSGIAVGSYPDTQSPWGLWDLSSTDQQHTEGYIHPSTGTRRLRQGSRTGSLGYVTDDRLDTVLTALPGLSLGGVRLATPVPSPASLGLLLGVVVVRARDRRHT